MKKLKIALIGAGPTMEQYIKALKSIKNPEIELCGIYSRTLSKSKKIQKKYNIKNLFKNIDDLYKNTHAEILFSIVSVENVGNVVIEASKYPWKIFTEKPFGINYKESIKIKNILGDKKDKIFIGLNRAFFSSTLNLIKLLKKDESTRIMNIFDQQDLSLFFDKKKYSTRFRRNLMYSNSIHVFTLIKLFIRGNKKNIRTIINYKNNSEKYIIKKITFSSGDIVILHSIWNRPGPWKMDLSTSNNFFSLNPLEQLYVRDKNSRQNIKINISKDDLDFKPGFKKQIEYFLTHFKGKKKSNLKFYLEIKELIKNYYFKIKLS